MLRTAAMSVLFFVVWVSLTGAVAEMAALAAPFGVVAVSMVYAMRVRGGRRSEARTPLNVWFADVWQTHMATMRVALLGRCAPILVRVRQKAARGILVDEGAGDRLIHVLDEEGAGA